MDEKRKLDLDELLGGEPYTPPPLPPLRCELCGVRRDHLRRGHGPLYASRVPVHRFWDDAPDPDWRSFEGLRLAGRWVLLCENCHALVHGLGFCHHPGCHEFTDQPWHRLCPDHFADHQARERDRRHRRLYGLP